MHVEHIAPQPLIPHVTQMFLQIYDDSHMLQQGLNN